MADRKEMRGGFDPREMQKRSAEARKRRLEAERKNVHESYVDIPLDQLGPKVLRELAANPNVSDNVRAQAAKALIDVPDEDDAGDWRVSVQVRPDYTPPSWAEALDVAEAAGAIRKKEYKAV